MVDVPEQYHEGVAAYPSLDCPYVYASQIGPYCAWWAGWHDTDRGLA